MLKFMFEFVAFKLTLISNSIYNSQLNTFLLTNKVVYTCKLFDLVFVTLRLGRTIFKSFSLETRSQRNFSTAIKNQVIILCKDID